MVIDSQGKKCGGVVVVCHGKFHHFALARQLEARGRLQRIYTGYPRWKLRDEGMPAERVATFPWFQTPLMGLGRFNIRNVWLERELSLRGHIALSRHVAARLEACEALVALSGSGLEAGAAQRARGGLYLCDRASSHIRYQDRLLREEFARWGLKFPGVDPRTIEREEQEYALANAIVVPSEFARRSFLAEGMPAERVITQPFGVDLERFSQVAAPERDKFQVLFIGQVSLRKGVPYLLEAFAKFRHPAKSLVIIGAVQPEIRDFLAQCDATVRVLGPIPQPQLKEWMSRSHVMVLPSIEEGMAYVQAQAMACGCPVIASANTGAEDLFTNGQEGFIVPIRNAPALNGAIEKLAADPALQAAMSAAAIQRAKQMGGWADYGERFVSMLGQLGVRDGN